METVNTIKMIEDGREESNRAHIKVGTANDFKELKGIDDSKLFCCYCAQKRRPSALSCLTICFLVLTYNLLGGYLFLALEGSTVTEETSVAASKPNLSRSQGTIDLRTKTVERLWSITEDLNILYKENWTRLAAKELLEFQKMLVKSMSSKSNGMDRLPYYHYADYRWNFAGSFLYALTLITTIGHGNVSPKSTMGKIAAVAYASVGIPLIMLYLSIIGEALARIFRSLYSKLCPTRLRKNNFHTKADCINRPAFNIGCRHADCDTNDNERQKRTPFQAALNLDSFNSGYHWTCRDHTRVPIILSALLIVLYITLGSFIFQKTERWNLLDGCFFSFSSLATIGFGNLRPGLYASTVSVNTEDMAVGVCCLYIIIGMVVIAMCFNMIQEEVSSVVRRITTLYVCNAKTSAVYTESCEEKIPMSLVS